MKTSEANELVTIKSFQNEIEAELAKAVLQNAGVKSFVFKDDCGGARPHMQLTIGVDLKVRSMDFARASEVLLSIGDSDRKSKELNRNENEASIFSLLSWVFCFTGSGFFLLSISKGKSYLLFGIVLLIIGILFWFRSWSMKNEDKEIS